MIAWASGVRDQDEFGFAGLVRVDAGLFLPLVSGTTDVRAFGGSG